MLMTIRLTLTAQRSASGPACRQGCKRACCRYADSYRLLSARIDALRRGGRARENQLARQAVEQPQRCAPGGRGISHDQRPCPSPPVGVNCAHARQAVVGVHRSLVRAPVAGSSSSGAPLQRIDARIVDAQTASVPPSTVPITIAANLSSTTILLRVIARIDEKSAAAAGADDQAPVEGRPHVDHFSFGTEPLTDGKG